MNALLAWPPSRTIWGGVVALAVIGASCGSDSPPSATPTGTAIPATATPTGPTATPTPDLTVLLRDGGIAIIEKAYDRLLDQYINPADPAALLGAAWSGAAKEAAAKGIAVPARPALSGDRAGDFAAFREAWGRLTGGVADPKEMRFAAIRVMAQSLNDCHTFFLNPVASTTLEDQRTGAGVVGVGIELAGVPPLVTEVISGSPAGDAGVLVGDRIASIDGADASAFGPAAAFDLINGEEGTAVRLRLRRPDAGTLIEATLTRARVTPPIVTSRVVGDGVGYVRVRQFVDGGINGQLKSALEEFERQGVTRWIIDLRDNAGGRLDTEAISLFVQTGVVARDRNREGDLHEDVASGHVLAVLRPTVLLTNNRTGSVSEVFAAALREYGLASLVGAPTNGCAGYTDIQPFGDGSSMAVTTHVNLGPVSNTPLSGTGLSPDVWVDRSQDDISNGRDPQLEAAIGYLAP